MMPATVNTPPMIAQVVVRKWYHGFLTTLTKICGHSVFHDMLHTAPTALLPVACAVGHVNLHVLLHLHGAHCTAAFCCKATYVQELAMHACTSTHAYERMPGKPSLCVSPG